MAVFCLYFISYLNPASSGSFPLRIPTGRYSSCPRLFLSLQFTNNLYIKMTTMDFKDLIKQLGQRVTSLKDQVLTEEATKNAFIMPFIKELGYDVFNPMEVVPEFVADVGIKQ